MELPGAVKQQEPVQAQPQQDNSGKPFPADRAEAMQFQNDLLQVLTNEEIYNSIVQQLSGMEEQGKAEAVGMITAHLVGNRVADVRGQTGRPIEMRLVHGAVMAVLKEVAEIAEDNGLFTMSDEEKKAALQVTVQVLEDTSKGAV